MRTDCFIAHDVRYDYDIYLLI